MKTTERFEGTDHGFTEFLWPRADLTVTVSGGDRYRFQIGKHYVILGSHDVEGLAGDLAKFIDKGVQAPLFASIYPEGMRGQRLLESSYVARDFAPDYQPSVRIRITDPLTRQRMALGSVDLPLATTQRLVEMLTLSLEMQRFGDQGLGAA